MLGKNKIKHLKSLKIKKFRDVYGEFIIEGEKIINELLEHKPYLIKELITTEQWLANNTNSNIGKIGNIITVTESDINKISFFETAGEVMAVLHIKEQKISKSEILSDLSLVLDTVQNPGNLGNIIRTADWFGIKNIFCSVNSVDCFNPKVVQASMGSIIRINVHYMNLKELLEEYSVISGFHIYGTFLDGPSIYNEVLDNSAFIILGNESMGISEKYLQYIKSRLYIPKYPVRDNIIESMNISAAAAIVCSEFRRRRK